MKTKDRILEKALELMNKLGLENVSTYNIANELEIRQSNITYYFPTKTDIVNALAKQMIVDVDEAFAAAAPGELTLKSFYAGVDGVMRAHQKYKFFMLNYASLITADRELNDHFSKVFEARHEQLRGVLTLLGAGGYIRADEMMPHSFYMLCMHNMLGIYWIQEAAIYGADKTDDQNRKHHLAIFFETFVPYLTEKGKAELVELLR